MNRLQEHLPALWEKFQSAHVRRRYQVLWEACQDAVRSTGLQDAPITNALGKLESGRPLTREEQEAVEKCAVYALSVAEQSLDEELRERWERRCYAAYVVSGAADADNLEVAADALYEAWGLSDSEDEFVRKLMQIME